MLFKTRVSTRFSHTWFAGFLCTAFIFLAMSASAQLPTGTILGTVSDPTGAVVAGATVVITNADTGASQTARTDSSGSYRFLALPPGHYNVKVEHEGFSTVEQNGLNLAIAQQAVLNVTLQVGSTTQEVTVTAQAQAVDTTTSALGGLVNETKISDLPLNGRNFIDLSLLQAGVTKQINPSPIGGGAGTEYSSNGAPIHSNNYLLDGAPIQNFLGASTTSIASTSLGVDGIKEFKVITNNFSAEYGMTMGSQLVIVSKGGSNEFHGDAYDYLRNSVLDARNYFDGLDKTNVNGFGTDKSLAYPGKRIPPFQRNDFGGALGGPIQKDRTFFYGAYEGLRVRQGLTNIDSNLSANCLNTTPGRPGNLTAGMVVWNGQGTQPAGSIGPCPQLGSNPNPFIPAGPSNNNVKVGAVSPAVVPYLNFAPANNIPSLGEYTFPFKEPITEDWFQIRVDRNISDKDALFVRYTFDNANLVQPVQTLFGNNIPEFIDNWRTRNQSATISENHIFSSTLLNVARLSATRTGIFTLSDVNPAFPGANSLPSFYPGQRPGGITAFGLTGYAPDSIAPSNEPQNVFTGSDDIFYTHGRNSLKFGFLANYFQDTMDLYGGIKGSLTFFTPALFFIGAQGSVGGQAPGSLPSSFFTWDTLGLYVQDDVKASSRLTLNLGLRYEFRTQVNARGNRSGAIRNVATDANFTVGPPMQNPSFRNFGPRLGFAWDIRGDGKTSLRGGASLLYDVSSFGAPLTNGVSGTPPFVVRFSIPSPPNPFGFTIPINPALIPTSANPSVFSALGATLGASAMDWNTKQPMSLQYNLSLERQLPAKTVLSIAYAGSRGYNLGSAWDQNTIKSSPVVAGVGTSATAPAGVVTNIGGQLIGCNGQPAPANLPAGWPCFGPGIATCGTKLLAASCRLNPNFDGLTIFNNLGKSWYDSLQVEVNKKVSHGLEFQSTYTYSHAIDLSQPQGVADGSGNAGAGYASVVEDIDNPIFNTRGPSVYDARHNWRFNALYHFPNFASSDHLISKFVNGWWVSPIVSIQTGYPFTPTEAGNQSGYGVSGATSGADRVDLVTPAFAGAPCAYGGTLQTFNANTVITGNPNEWFNPCMFMAPQRGNIGTAPRGVLRGPGLQDVDFALNKDTRLGLLGEQGALEFRAEVFNILNHANFGYPQTNVYSGFTPQIGTVGLITSTATSSRQIQLALKVIF